MPRTAEQNERIRQATKNTIIYSAIVLFAQKGFAHTTVRMIAESADISIGLMYHYFDNKGSLLEAVFQYCMEILSGAFTNAYNDSLPGARIGSIVTTMFDILQRDREFWGLFYMMRSQPAVMEILGDSFKQWTMLLRNVFIAELRTMNRAEPEIDALLLYSLIEGTIQQYLLDPDYYPLEVVTERIIGQVTTS